MLNPKQRRHLRALGNTTKASVQIGKDGLGDTVLVSVDQSLTAHGLIKVSVLKSCPTTMMELALDLSAQTHSEIVQIIGKSLLLYRESEKNPLL